MSTSKGPDNSDRRLPAALSLLHLNLMGVVNLPVSMDPLASADPPGLLEAVDLSDSLASADPSDLLGAVDPSDLLGSVDPLDLLFLEHHHW